MSSVAVRIPQMGEGLQEARLVAVLKKPGDPVKRDEPIYQMETDKAVMDVESPFEGVLVEWLAEVDAVLPIGAEVARMEVAGDVTIPTEPTVGSPEAKAAAPVVDIRSIPPRTRAYAKEKGLADAVLAALLPIGSKLMPEDVDLYLAGGATATFDDAAVLPKQRVLASRLMRGSQLVVPGTMSVVVDWSAIEERKAEQKARGDEFRPSTFTMFAFAVAKALADFPAFRSTLIGDSTLRTYRHANLGIAVTRPPDELLLAVIDNADTLSWREFAETARGRISRAREGEDQANEATTLSLTNMQSFGLRDAVPVVVAPAAATLFLGEVYDAWSPMGGKRQVNLALTFDHRIMNGVGAANFLTRVRENVQAISSLGV